MSVYEYISSCFNRIDFIKDRKEITTDYQPGSVQDVLQHDGTTLRLRKVAKDYDASDRVNAMNYLQQHARLGEIVTGLLYVDSSAEDLHRHLNTVEKPLNQLGDAYLCPGNKALEALNAALR